MIPFRHIRIILVVILCVGGISAGGPPQTSAEFKNTHPGTANFTAADKFSEGGNCPGGSTVYVNATGPSTVSEDSLATLDGEACYKHSGTRDVTWSFEYGSAYGQIADQKSLDTEFEADLVNQDRDVKFKLTVCYQKNQNKQDCGSDTLEMTVIDEG